MSGHLTLHPEVQLVMHVLVHDQYSTRKMCLFLHTDVQNLGQLAANSALLCFLLTYHCPPFLAHKRFA